MSAREWKPGDVAMVTTPRTSFRAWKRTGDLWVDEEGVEFSLHTVGASDWTARPLVVIDPDSDDDLDRFCKLLVEQMHRAGDRASAAKGVHPATVQAALREFADPKPPKPDEPTGLGAVVECDYDGKHGTAVFTGAGWTFYGEHLVDHSADWGAFDAVRVLAEGVTQ